MKVLDHLVGSVHAALVDARARETTTDLWFPAGADTVGRDAAGDGVTLAPSAGSSNAFMSVPRPRPPAATDPALAR